MQLAQRRTLDALRRVQTFLDDHPLFPTGSLDATIGKMADGIFELPLTAAAAELLADVARATTLRPASTLFKQFLAAASQSEQAFNAALFATQMVRDLAIINRRETAFVLQQIIDNARVEWLAPHGSVLEFYRARGEHVTATIMEQDLPKAKRYAKRGRLSLVYGKPLADVPVDSIDPVRVIEEHVHALPVSETKQDRTREWRGLVQALKDTSVLSAVRTVASLRDSKALSVTLATRLIDIAISETVKRLCHRDPTLHDRLDDVRARQIKVDCLRLLGERELADLLLTDPGAYKGRLDRSRPPRGPLLPTALEAEVEEALLRLETLKRHQA